MTRVVVSEQAMKAELKKMQRQMERQVELCAGTIAQVRQHLATTERRVLLLEQQARHHAVRGARTLLRMSANVLAGAMGGVAAALIALRAARR